MRLKILSCITTLWCLLLAAPAAAQVQNRPAREAGSGLFGGGQGRPARSASQGRTTQQLFVTTDVVGAHDRFSRFGGVSGGTSDLDPLGRRSAGIVNGMLHYNIGRGTHWFETSGAGFVTGREASQTQSGGEVRASMATSLGQRNIVETSQSFRYAPSLSLGEFTDLAAAAGPAVVESDPTLATVNRTSRVLTSSVSYARRWSPRQATTIGYAYSRNDYSGDVVGFDSRTQTANAQHAWQFSRVASALVRYYGSRSSYPGTETAEITGHNASVGTNYAKRISPTRHVVFGGEIGASYTETIVASSSESLGRWMPSGSGSIRVDVGRSWAVNADFRRSAIVLEQVALQTFYNDAFAVTAGGLLGRRLDATFTAGLSRGRTPAGLAEPGRYESYGGSAQLRLAVSRWCASVLSYSLYDYQVRRVELPRGFPAHSRVNGLRVGLTLWFPVIGARTARTSER